MRILSATEAVSPAIARTKLILFKPFRLGRSWKFAATAYVSQTGTFFFPFPLLFLIAIPATLHTEQKWIVWAVTAGVALLLALTTFLFVLCSRLQFPFMDVVMNRSVFIAPLWRQYGPQARRWVQTKIVIGTITSTLLGIPFAVLGWAIFHGLDLHANHQDPQLEFRLIGGFYLFTFLIYGVIGLVMLVLSLLNDFMLPPLALEDAPVADAWQWVRKLVRAEPGQIALYALLKVILGLIAQLAFGIAMEIALLLLVVIIFLAGMLLGLLLHAVHLPAVILQVLGIVVFGSLYLGFIGYAAPFASGITMTFLEAYKLYFLGGRYAPLGDLLDRSTPPSEPLPPAPQYGYVSVQSDPPANLP